MNSDDNEDDSTESMETQGPVDFIIQRNKEDEEEDGSEREEGVLRVFEPTALVTLEELETSLNCIRVVRENTEKMMFYMNELTTILLNIKRSLIK